MTCSKFSSVFWKHAEFQIIWTCSETLLLSGGSWFVTLVVETINSFKLVSCLYWIWIFLLFPLSWRHKNISQHIFQLTIWSCTKSDKKVQFVTKSDTELFLLLFSRNALRLKDGDNKRKMNKSRRTRGICQPEDPRRVESRNFHDFSHFGWNLLIFQDSKQFKMNDFIACLEMAHFEVKIFT